MKQNSFILLSIMHRGVDVGQLEQNWNNNKIKGYDLGVST